MDQQELKKAVGQAALQYVKPGEILGVGTGSTVDCFIDALKESDISVPACVSSSVRSTNKLQAYGFKVLDLNEVEKISVYVDGADEIAHELQRIGNNLNQLTRAVNAGFVRAVDLGETKQEVQKVWQSLNSLLRDAR